MREGEFSDARAVIIAEGLAPDDFSIEAYDISGSSCGALPSHAPHLEIRITYKKSGRCRVYRTNNDSAWPATLSDDIKKGEFLQ